MRRSQPSVARHRRRRKPRPADAIGPAPPPVRLTYSVRDLEERYGVREHTVLAWIHSGELRAVNVGVAPGKKKPRWRVTQAAVDAFEAGRTPAPAEPVLRRRRRAKVVEFYPVGNAAGPRRTLATGSG
jgi:Helix-turn-helix domain